MTFRSIQPIRHPWFSHQHDPQFLADNTTLTLFDNGNVRNLLDPTANSRGQVIQLDEQNRIANLIVNIDMGQFSFALGAAQKLPNGNYHFDIGYLLDGTSIAVEVDPSGNTCVRLACRCAGVPVLSYARPIHSVAACGRSTIGPLADARGSVASGSYGTATVRKRLLPQAASATAGLMTVPYCAMNFRMRDLYTP